MIATLKWIFIVSGMFLFFLLIGAGSDPIAYAWKMSPGTPYYEEEEIENISVMSTTSTQFYNVNAVSGGVATATSSAFSVRVPVMVYHSVRPYMVGESKYQDAYDVTPQLLEQELQYLAANGFQTVTFGDVIAYFQNGVPLPEKPVVLSFDDGWKNQYTYALPLLMKYHAKATFFIYTNPINHQHDHWMSWADVEELDRAGMEIGGHSWTHPVLPEITSDEMLDKEILESKHTIEEHIGHPIVVFAYPFGMYNEQTKSAVIRAGYQIARTVYGGVWNDPLRRFEFHGTLSSDDAKAFERLLSKE